jgi:hypothetical protein
MFTFPSRPGVRVCESRGRRFVQHYVTGFFFDHVPGNIPYTHNDMADLIFLNFGGFCGSNTPILPPTLYSYRSTPIRGPALAFK